MGGYRPHQALSLAVNPPREVRGKLVRAREALAALDAEEPVALVDFEVYDDGTAALGMVVAPAARGRGLGRMIVELLLHSNHLKGVREVLGGIEPENVASVKCFEAAGFVSDSSEPDEEGIIYFRRKVSERERSYDGVTRQLRVAYDQSASDRDQTEKSPWKLSERGVFLQRLRAEGKSRMLEIGAGTGQDSLYFKEQGLNVLATDLSEEMVKRCRAKGLDALQADVLNLGVPPSSFDAAYAMNCFLHIPNSHLAGAFAAVHAVLAPDSLFYLGVYGGDAFEGDAPDDWHDPPRFFSFRTDEQLLEVASRQFEVVDFHGVPLEDDHFQSLTLRRREVRGWTR